MRRRNKLIATAFVIGLYLLILGIATFSKDGLLDIYQGAANTPAQPSTSGD